jgi:hypothetical protein
MTPFRWPWLAVVAFGGRSGATVFLACAWALHVMTFSPTDPHGVQGPPLYATRTYATRTECQRGAAAFYRVGFQPGVLPLAFCAPEPKECDPDATGGHRSMTRP